MPEHIIGNILGVKGPKGDTGNTGLQGLTGPTGATGTKGVAGDTGLKGLRGDQGPIGPKGPPGSAEDVTLAGLGGVPNTRKINGKALSSDIVLTTADVAAVPTSRTVNGHSFTGNIVLTQSNINGAFTLEQHSLPVQQPMMGTDITCVIIDVITIVSGVIIVPDNLSEQTVITELPHQTWNGIETVSVVGDNENRARIEVSGDTLIFSLEPGSNPDYFRFKLIPIHFAYFI